MVRCLADLFERVMSHIFSDENMVTLHIWAHIFCYLDFKSCVCGHLNWKFWVFLLWVLCDLISCYWEVSISLKEESFFLNVDTISELSSRKDYFFSWNFLRMHLLEEKLRFLYFCIRWLHVGVTSDKMKGQFDPERVKLAFFIWKAAIKEKNSLLWDSTNQDTKNYLFVLFIMVWHCTTDNLLGRMSTNLLR